MSNSRPVLTIVSFLLNGALSAATLPGVFILISWGDHIPGFQVMAWFLYVFPWANMLSVPLSLFAHDKPLVLKLTLWAGIGGLLYDAYLLLAMFVWLQSAAW